MTKFLISANIYTLDPHRPRASAIVIDGERILRVGERQELWAEFAGKDDRVEIL